MPIEQPGSVKPPMTNADRIRSLSDEELAEREVRCAIEFFENGQSGYYKRVWKTSDGAIFVGKQLAIEYELQWLKQPYGGTEHDA